MAKHATEVDIMSTILPKDENGNLIVRIGHSPDPDLSLIHI